MGNATRHKPNREVMEIASFTMNANEDIDENKAISIAKTLDHTLIEKFSSNNSSSAYLKYFNFNRKRKDIISFEKIGKYGFSYRLPNKPDKKFVCIYY